uniref:DUF4219 domain-containing protein n=1 Tax=Nelumbo nucifera TaxID=4432 RepID=A0A822YL09_NELNU|nr:TPA_asm: hypothetical protein HUJ06_012121 [Nelumbo nucifera]
MNGGSAISNICVDKLVGNNYSYWKLCMEAYLQGQDLWDLIASDEAVIPADNPQIAELRRKWKIKCGKALFALRTSTSKEYIEHVCDLKSPKQLWETLERLFTQRNTMRMIQGNLSILEYFLKIETLCSEISELDTEEPVSDAHLHHYLIRGLRKEKWCVTDAGNQVIFNEIIVSISMKEQMLHMKIMNLNGNNAYSLKILINRSIDEGLSFKDVYHVLGLKKNLASVSQIIDSGRKELLYVLSASDAYVEKTCQNASAALWHARLGHKLLDGIPIFKDLHHDMVCFGC